jgi:hypothetical protein
MIKRKAHSRIRKKISNEKEGKKQDFSLITYFLRLITGFFLKRKHKFWLILFNFFIYFYFYYIFYNFYPNQVKDILIENSYLIVLIPGFFFIFNFLYFIFEFFIFDLLLGLFFIFFLYLKLQRFVFNQELYLVNLWFFVIIGLILLLLKFLKYAYFSKKTKPKRRRRFTR